MPTMTHKQQAHVLRQARRVLGLWMHVKKRFVFAGAAHKMGRPVPTQACDGYALLAEFIALPESQMVRQQRAAERRQARHVPDVNADEFLQSYAWRSLRMRILTKYGARCQCCGATPKDGVRIHVDHIKPRRRFPELALDEGNLQVLCEDCNHGKGNWDATDWREGKPNIEESTGDDEARYMPMWHRPEITH